MRIIIKDNIENCLEYLTAQKIVTPPFTLENQVHFLSQLYSNGQKFEVTFDIETLSSRSKEWGSNEYKEWHQKKDLSIFLFDGQMPCFISHNNTKLFLFHQDNYFFHSSRNVLYINSEVDRQQLLWKIIADGKTGMLPQDFKILFVDGKVSVSKDFFEENNHKIKSLESENDRLRKEIEHYKLLLGEGPTIQRGNINGLSKIQKIDSQLEAQRFLKDYMPQWAFPSDYGTIEGNYYSICDEIYDEEGNNIVVVLKSHKAKEEPLHITTEDWDALMDGAKLFIYTTFRNKPDIVEIDSRDLIMNQSNISLTFSTENLDIEKYEERVSALSESLHYFTGMTFDFESFNLSAKATSIKELYNKVEGKQNEISDEEGL